MAASCEENDYVHLVMKKVRQEHPDAQHKIAWAVAWERAYWDAIHLVAFREFLNFEPDIIVIKINENVSSSNNIEHPYKKYYNKLLEYLNPEGSAQLILCTGFWKMGVIDEAVRETASGKNLPLVELNHLDEDEAMKAIGLFEHAGVAHHPGDKGMKAIADLIIKSIYNVIERKGY